MKRDKSKIRYEDIDRISHTVLTDNLCKNGNGGGSLVILFLLLYKYMNYYCIPIKG